MVDVCMLVIRPHLCVALWTPTKSICEESSKNSSIWREEKERHRGPVPSCTPKRKKRIGVSLINQASFFQVQGLCHNKTNDPPFVQAHFFSCLFSDVFFFFSPGFLMHTYTHTPLPIPSSLCSRSTAARRVSSLCSCSTAARRVYSP